MKIDIDDLLTTNRTLVENWAKGVLPGDPSSILKARAADLIDISDGGSGQDLTVVVKPRMALVVSKGADLDNILSLIRAATNGEVAALGTHAVSDLAATGSLAGATIATLRKIMGEQHSNDAFNFTVPVTELDPERELTARLTMVGMTKTTDSDSDERAEANFVVTIGGLGDDRRSTTNIGTERVIDLNTKPSTARKQLNDDSETVEVIFKWALETDGAFTYDTVSVVQLTSFTLHLEYAPLQ